MSRSGHRSISSLLCLFAAGALLTADAAAQAPPAPAQPPKAAAAPAWAPKTPLGLVDVTAQAPADNPITKAKWTLGKMLFWDKRLSGTGTHACETCHIPELGWTDGKTVSQKAGGAMNTRHTPALYNLAYNTSFYWDGRSPTLEAQVKAAWEGQMAAKDKTADIAKNIGAIAGYKTAFADAFKGGEATADHVVAAIATFVRTIMNANSPYDAYSSGATNAISEQAKRGYVLFRTKARCATCHPPGLFTDNGFHNLGFGGGTAHDDPGYGKTVNNASYNGAFKTPTLRKVLAHPPFTHTGTFRSIDEILKYLQSPYAGPNLDPFIQGGIKLTEAEQADLKAFLGTLEGADDPEVSSKPELP